MTRQRICPDCGAVFDAVREDDWYCKSCLLIRYKFAAEFGVDYSQIGFTEEPDPPMVDSGPGGS